VLRRLLSIACLALALANCSQSFGGTGGNSDPTSTQAPSTPTREAACVDRSEVTSLLTATQESLDAAVGALGDTDISGSMGPIRVAASNMRAVGDVVEPVDSATARHFYRAADAFDNGITAMSEGNYDSGVSYAEQGLAEVEPALEGLVPLFC
jgi:hypothetical protein